MKIRAPLVSAQNIIVIAKILENLEVGEVCDYDAGKKIKGH